MDSIPACANDFIEEELHTRLHSLEEAFDAQALSFSGPLMPGVDDYVRDYVERLASRSDHQRRLLVLVTTGGGIIEVVQRIVEVLRYHYDHVVFAVPNYAYSAGTVLVMSGNDIYMDYYSRLGPIDPQVQKDGIQVPALGYIEQWERLLRKAKAGELTTVEAQLMIQGFDQAELYLYEQARDLSIALLQDWLTQYKFAEWTETEDRKKPVTPKMRSQRAVAIARKLSDTGRWHSHGHGISREVLERDVGLRISDLDKNPNLALPVKSYYSLADDYMQKMGRHGSLHIVGSVMFFM